MRSVLDQENHVVERQMRILHFVVPVAARQRVLRGVAERRVFAVDPDPNLGALATAINAGLRNESAEMSFGDRDNELSLASLRFEGLKAAVLSWPATIIRAASTKQCARAAHSSEAVMVGAIATKGSQGQHGTGPSIAARAVLQIGHISTVTYSHYIVTV
jgi:hypothetical protein